MNREKSKRNKAIYDLYQKKGLVKGGISFKTIGEMSRFSKEDGTPLSAKQVYKIYLREVKKYG